MGTSAPLRAIPPNDKQPDFFVPTLYDVPLKDDVSLMDVAPYRLTGRSKTNTIEYQLNDAHITIEGGATVGMATVKDYDIVIHMISYLNAEMESYRKGFRDDVPPRKYRPNSYEILKFMRREDGGKQYKELEQSLRRLRATSITIVSESGTRRKAEGFGLIERWKVVSKTRTGKVQTLEITIPDWIYEGIVRDETPTVLTLHPDYFLLSSAMDRTLYRLARRCAGRSEWTYPMRDVFLRSGSTQRFSDFSARMREGFAEPRQILEYDVTLRRDAKGERLYMRHRKYQVTQEIEAVGRSSGAPWWENCDIRPHSAPKYVYDILRKVAPNLDPDHLISEWLDWSRSKAAPTNPIGALRSFVVKKLNGNR